MSKHRRTIRTGAAVARRLLLDARDTVILVFCLLGLAAAWLGYGLAGSGAGPSQAAAAPDTVSAAPLPAVPAAPPHAAGLPSAVVPAGPAVSAPERISLPAADFDVVVHPLEPGAEDVQSRSIVPPETKDGYWLQPLGAPGAGSTNTTYVVGHSWLDQDAPFNHLSTRVAVGALLSVTTSTGVIGYRVDSVTTYTKSTLKDSPVWQVVPNRLVLISCYTEDPWGRNVVLVASPLPSP